VTDRKCSKCPAIAQTDWSARRAMAVREHLHHVGLEIWSEVHASECEESGGKLVGAALHIGHDCWESLNLAKS
jgi:hypothetical protein